MLPIKPKKGPEAKIQEAVIKMLRSREWFVKATHGNLYSHGFPDLYACHHKYGARWVEIKNADSYHFTAAQMIDFPRFSAAGARIWVLVAATEEEYQKLFGPENWFTYLKQMGFRH